MNSGRISGLKRMKEMA